MTRDQIITGLVAYREAEMAKLAAKPLYGLCGCTGKRDKSEPYCRCIMEQAEAQADAILKVQHEATQQ